MTSKLALLAVVSVFLAQQFHHGEAFRPTAVRRSPVIMQKSSLLMKTEENKVPGNSFNWKILPAILGAATLFSTGIPMNVDAASSGGRSGGSSFRSSGGSYSSGRSSTRLNSYSSGGSSYSSTTIITPGYGYGYGLGGFGFGFSPFSYGLGFVSPGSFLTLAAVSVGVYLLLNRVGGSSFNSNVDSESSLGDGATVVKLQLALDSDWADNNNIMNTLAAIAAQSERYSERQALANLLSEVSIALLRRKADWSAAAITGEKFRGERDAVKAEPLFQKFAVQERAKFERESSVEAMTSSVNANMFRATPAVVSLVVAVRGQSEGLRNGRSRADVVASLQALASDALTDGGENILGVEVLWTPSERGQVLDKRELITDYPELIQL